MSDAHTPRRFARETIQLNMKRDALGDDELAAETLSTGELELDKELIRLIQTACKANNPARALDLVRLLHLTPSLDSAAKVAGFYQLDDLRTKICRLHEAHEAHNHLEDRRERHLTRRDHFAPVPKARMIIVERKEHRAKVLQDFRSPPAIHRPGLERATAAPATVAGPSRVYATGLNKRETDSPQEDAANEHEHDATSLEGKRKGSQSEDAAGATKKRATDVLELASASFAQQAKTNPFARKRLVDGTETDKRKRESP